MCNCEYLKILMYCTNPGKLYHSILHVKYLKIFIMGLNKGRYLCYNKNYEKYKLYPISMKCILTSIKKYTRDF